MIKQGQLAYFNGSAPKKIIIILEGYKLYPSYMRGYVCVNANIIRTYSFETFYVKLERAANEA